MKINIGKWAKQQLLGGQPITIESVAELALAFKLMPSFKNVLEASVKESIIKALELDKIETKLLKEAPAALAPSIQKEFANLKVKITNWHF
jgi:hypothetical protein